MSGILSIVTRHPESQENTTRSEEKNKSIEPNSEMMELMGLRTLRS